jgi:hypothetical protein
MGILADASLWMTYGTGRSVGAVVMEAPSLIQGAGAAVLVVPGIGADAEDLGLHALPPAANAAASNL